MHYHISCDFIKYYHVPCKKSSSFKKVFIIILLHGTFVFFLTNHTKRDIIFIIYKKDCYNYV